MTNISNVVCRVCESPDDLEMIFEKVNAEILKMLQAATPSDIKEDDLLPKHICIPCIFTLEDFYEFKSLYECTREKLKKKRINNVLIKESADNVTVRNDTTILEKKSNGVNELGLLVINRDLRLGNSDVSCDLNEDNCSKRLEEEAGKNTTNFDDKDQRSHIGKPETTKSRAPSDNKMGNEKHYLFLNASISDENPDQICSKSESYQCIRCGQVFEHWDLFETHKSMQLCVERSSCEINDEAFKTSGHLEMCLTLQPGESLSIDAETSMYECNICGKVYSTLYIMKKHQVLHLNPDLYKCEDCGKSFSSSNSLERHAAVHLKWNRYKCDVCGKSFIFPHSLKAHAAKHLKLVLFKCYICGKSFSTSFCLKLHKARHANPDGFKCHKCPKSFSRLRNLKVHTALHSNPDLYKCDKCNKSFTNARSCKSHKALHMNPSIYACDICGKSYQNTSSLKKHQVSNHSKF